MFGANYFAQSYFGQAYSISLKSGDVAVPFPLSIAHPEPKLVPMSFIIPYSNTVPVNTTVSQSGATITFTGGTQSESSVNIAGVSQSGATVTFSGGTQSVVATAADSIAYDSSAAGVLVNPGTSQTWSHTCGIGSNRLLLVGLFGNITTDAITGVTYGGVAMTRIAMTQVPTDRFVYLYYLIAPATGTNNVVISANASIAIEGLSASYIGVNQTYPIDSSTTNTGTSGTSLTTAINTLIANDWIFTVGKTVSSTPTSGTLATRRQEANDIMIADSNGAVALSGSQNVTFNWSVTNDSAAILAAFSPASAISVTITQVGATLTATGGTQSVVAVQTVSITQTHATLTVTGGTQTVATVNIVALSQVAANLTFSGGTQVINTINIVTTPDTSTALLEPSRNHVFIEPIIGTEVQLDYSDNTTIL